MTAGEFIVLGIDPGLAAVGWARIRPYHEGRPYCLESGAHETAPGPDWRERIADIAVFFGEMLDVYTVDLVSIESYTYQGERSYAANLIRIPRVIQRISDLCVDRAIPCIEVTTTEAKSAVGLRGKCDKRRVRLMVESMLAGRLPKNNHARDAVVAAIAGEKKWRSLQMLESYAKHTER